MKPLVKSGRFHAGSDLQCGENVVIDVAEEVVVGDRCVLSDNAYFSGRRIQIGDDFFSYSWEWKRLDVGRGRKDDEHATLTVGSRCTFHDNRIDLAAPVVIGDDVGLSPEVVIYTHGYWLSILEGYPATFDPVIIQDGVIVGFRSVVLPGAFIGKGAVVGAQSVVRGHVGSGGVYAGSPAKRIRDIAAPSPKDKELLLWGVIHDYGQSRCYRKLSEAIFRLDYPVVEYRGCRFDCEKLTVAGEEDADTDDWRDFAFRRGLRFYTRRPFRKLGRKT